MDLSIYKVTPDILRDRGAEDYDRGFDVHDHGMTDRAQIKHCEFGWHQRRQERANAQMARAA